jgi:hypothetical protein
VGLSLPGQQAIDDGRALAYPEIEMDPLQLRVREWFASLESLRWMPLASFVGTAPTRVSTFSALAPRTYRPKALASPGWDLHHGSGRPGFSQSFSRGRTKTTYQRHGSSPVEPLLHERAFYGARADYSEVSEEFRLFHDLYDDRTNGRLLRIEDAADPEVAVRFHGESVWVLGPLLRQYQAARHMDLLLFIDSTIALDGPVKPHREDWQTAEVNASLVVGDVDGRWFSNFMATRVVPAPRVTESGVWPYEKRDEYFPEFIIGVDAMGNEIRFTCNPDKLANYFGANAGAPHYLTAVHFRREVLAKYHDNPTLYSIEDGYLRCAGLWGFRMDNDGDDVVAHLGDLGRDLPVRERDYWRSFNIAPMSGITGLASSKLPTGGFSETAIRRGFLAQATEARSVDLRVQKTYRRLGTVWANRFGWPIFLEPEPGDAHLLQDVRRPLRDTDVEFESLVRTLAKLYIDFLNEADIVRGLPPGPKDEKGIGKLERFLRAGLVEPGRIVAFLRDLQDLRSKGVAHRKGEGYERVLERILGVRRRGAACEWLLEEALEITERLIGVADGSEQTT